MEVLQLLKPPTTLFSPRVAWKALWAGHKQADASTQASAAGGEPESRGLTYPGQQSPA